MSHVPIFYRDWWDDGWWNGLTSTNRFGVADQRFGCGIINDDVFRSMSGQPEGLRRLRLRKPWGNISQLLWSSLIDKDRFQMNLDVQQFAPNEITVATVDNTIVIEGKHEEKPDEHGLISRKFVRRYMVPEEYDPKTAYSCLSSEGVLTITLSKKLITPSAANERIIPITKPNEKAN